MVPVLALLASLVLPQAQVFDTTVLAQDHHAAAVLAPTVTPLLAARITAASAVTDTPTVAPRQIAIEHSDAYYTRLTIHRWASYAMLPVFAGQWIAGQRLMNDGASAPGWARNGHRVLATATAGLFGINTITGGMNWWQARKDPDGKTLRTLHAASMLLADAGFTAVGLLANRAENDGQARTLHKQIALGSMGLTVASMVVMLPIFRGD